MDTKTKLVDDLKEELGEKDRRIGAALQEVERLNNVVFDKVCSSARSGGTPAQAWCPCASETVLRLRARDGFVR